MGRIYDFDDDGGRRHHRPSPRKQQRRKSHSEWNQGTSPLDQPFAFAQDRQPSKAGLSALDRLLDTPPETTVRYSSERQGTRSALDRLLTPS
jgi:hypothetical protein